jgi:PAS domain-containing protein
LGLILGLLDDLFGGRARIHLYDRTTRVLRPTGVDEPPITAPGPLHLALGTTAVVVEHVGTSLPPAWSASYRAWMTRGECHLVASRIEGGGEVVGVLSVLRNENTSVPVAEDRALVGALAARIGRSAAVTLARATDAGVEPASTEPGIDPPEPDLDIDLRTEAAGGDVGRGAEAQAAAPSPEPHEHLPESAATALHLDEDRLELALTTTDAVIDAESEKTLVAVLEALASPLSDMSPKSGIRIEFARSGPDWVASIRPKLLAEGWPVRPSISDSVAATAGDRGADIDVVANPELGWLIEIRTPADRAAAPSRVSPDGRVMDTDPAENPEDAARTRLRSTSLAPDAEPGPTKFVPDAGASDEDVDLMAASLGDTARMLMIAISGDGRVVFCNDELAARLGLSVADLLGRPFRSAKGSDGAWDEFGRLFARVVDAGLAQQTLSWPHPEESGQRIRWTVSRSSSRSGDQEARPIYLCFGVDV